MKLVKLLNVLPQSAPGNRETHFGQMCEIRGDGVYCELEDGLADLFISCSRAKLVEDVKAVLEVPQETKAVEILQETVHAHFVLGVQGGDVIESKPVAEEALLGFGSYQEESVAAPEPETIASKIAGKRGPKPKNV